MARRAFRSRAAVLLLLLLSPAAAAPPLGRAAPAAPATAAEPVTAEDILAMQPPQLVERLLDERVVLLQEFSEEQHYGGMVHALVLFDRPRNEVLRFLIQSARQVEFRPELRRADVVEAFDESQVVHYEIRMMLMRVEYQAVHHWDFERGLVWWSLDPDFDNDLARLEGRWEVFPMGPDRALARFGTRIDVGPALPAFLQDYATRTKLPESMQHVRRWIDSGGTYRP